MIAQGAVGTVRVFTTHGRGFTPEELADQALLKIMMVSTNAPPEVREQAVAFQEKLRAVLIHYMHEAIRNHEQTGSM